MGRKAGNQSKELVIFCVICGEEVATTARNRKYCARCMRNEALVVKRAYQAKRQAALAAGTATIADSAGDGDAKPKRRAPIFPEWNEIQIPIFNGDEYIAQDGEAWH
jgi:hypothetical protein